MKDETKGTITVILIFAIIFSVFGAIIYFSSTECLLEHSGVIADFKYDKYTFGNHEKTAIYFEDGSTFTAYSSTEAYSLEGLYLFAKNNVGKSVTILYDDHHNNCVKSIVFD